MIQSTFFKFEFRVKCEWFVFEMLLLIKHDFYNFAKIDSSHLLITIMKNIVRILKVLNNIFFEVKIQKKDHYNKYINYFKNESIKEKTD
jgi:hypothetical protein